MKKEPDSTNIALAAGIVADIEAERDVHEAELEERILQLEEEVARLRNKKTPQNQARVNAINAKKAAAAQRKKSAEARRTAIFIIMLLQALFYIGLAIYMVTHY